MAVPRSSPWQLQCVQVIKWFKVNLRRQSPFLLLHALSTNKARARLSRPGFCRFTREMIVSWLSAMCVCMSFALAVMTCVVCHLNRRLRGCHDFIHRILIREFYRTDDH
jgi:hypothetical protein